MLLPYNVERPTRLVPKFTYGLMGINIAIYLLTIIHANILLPGEKAALRETEDRLRQQSTFDDSEGETSEFDPSQTPGGTGVAPGFSPGVPSSPTSPEPPPMPGSVPPPPPPSSSDFSSLNFGTFPTSKYNFNFMQRGQMTPGGYGTDPSSVPGQGVPSQATLDDPAVGNGAAANGVAESGAETTVDKDLSLLDALSDKSALKEKMKTKEGLYEVQTLMWRVEHADDMFVLEPHPSALNIFAYHAGAPSLWSFLTAMFLHGDLMHLLGNMLFLWVFGRATEDALGPVVFVAAYMVCGYAATLLYHIMAMQFTPDSVMVPSLGASGAIAGVQGLFAPRFYRTPVRVLYTTWNGLRIFGPVAAILGLIFANVLEMGTPGVTLGFLCAFAALIFFGEDTLWREFRLAAMWLIGGWVVWNDIIPVLMQIAFKSSGDGVAHWAHIGGLFCGVAYAFLIGANKEGKAEYLIEDARRSLDNKYAGNAIEHAQKLVKEMPEKAEGYQLLAEAYDHKNEADKALDNYELAIEKYIKSDERDQAMRLYTEILQKHPLFILKPKTQFAIANQMAVRGHFDKAAENWAKIPFTFPDAPEGEQALLRAGQIYVERLDQKEMGLHLLNTLLERHPSTPLMTQVKTIMHRAQNATVALDDLVAVKAATLSATVPRETPGETPTPKPVEKPVQPNPVAAKAAVSQPATPKPVAAKPAVEKPVAPDVVQPVAQPTVTQPTMVQPTATQSVVVPETLSQPILQPIAMDVVTQEADLDTSALPSFSVTPQPATPTATPAKSEVAQPSQPPKVEEPAVDDLLSMPMNFSKPAE